jgi:hypothetical protein
LIIGAAYLNALVSRTFVLTFTSLIQKITH